MADTPNPRIESEISWDARARNIMVVCHTMSTAVRGSLKSNNHWSIYLIIGAKKSVRFNMWSAPGSPTVGILSIKQHNYEKSDSTIRSSEYPAKNLKVQDFYKLLIDKKYHKYQMSEKGTGCCWWVYQAMLLGADKGYLDKSKVEDALLNALQYQYSKKMDLFLVEMVRGTFIA